MKEATAALGISVSTLYAALSKGQLAAYKPGNRTLIDTSVLQAWW